MANHESAGGGVMNRAESLPGITVVVLARERNPPEV